ncbi:MAG: M16 family metallopeptidase [Acidobacteriota bacterium]
MSNRKQPPRISGLPVYKLPPVAETQLANGLCVVLVEDKRFPMVTARLGFQAGTRYDPPELRGLSETTAALLTEGTATRTSRRIAEEVAGIGGTLHADSSPDALVVAASALAEHLPELLDLTADVVQNPSFPEEEVALRKQNRKQELAAQRAEASFLADEKFSEVLYGPHPYARQDPTPESIDCLTRDAIAAFRAEHLFPNNAVLVLLGALPERKQLLALLESKFGGWAQGSAAAPPTAELPAPERSLVLVDRAGSVQADIRIGRLAVTRTDPDYFPLLVANTILGGGAASRLFAIIREKEGFAYDARSALSPMKDAGSFAVITQVRNEVLAPAIEAALGEMRRIATEDVTPDELETAKNYLSGVFVMRIETLDGLASQLAAVKLLGLPIDYLEQYTKRVRAVDAAALRAAAAKYIRPDAAALVAVGDASAARKELEKFGSVTVVKAEE